MSKSDTDSDEQDDILRNLVDDLARALDYTSGAAEGNSPAVQFLILIDLLNIDLNTELAGANLSGMDLSGVNLRGADLRGINFMNANLEGADLREAKLGGSNFEGARLRKTDFRGADLTNLELGGVDLSVAVTGSSYPESSTSKSSGGRKSKDSKDKSNLIERLVEVKRVARVIKGGRRFSFNAVVVVGDGMGQVGSGLGEAVELNDAIAKGTEAAKNAMFSVPVTETGTIPRGVRGRQGAGIVVLRPASDGTGVIAGGGVRTVLECAGIRNVLAKSQGASNPSNVVAATINALANLQDQDEASHRRRVLHRRSFKR